MEITANFDCPSPNFQVRSLLGGVVFGARRECLKNSEAFAGMLLCCDDSETASDYTFVDHSAQVTSLGDSNVLTLDEKEEKLSILLHLLHSPPAPPVFYTREERKLGIRHNVIPYPLLLILLSVADKYALVDPIIMALHEHMSAHAMTYPLQVYAFATTNGLDCIADTATQYLLDPPIASYSLQDIGILPSIEAYHKLVQLQAVRISRLKKLVREANLFPYGYGTCTYHSRRSILSWEAARQELLTHVGAATDVTAELSPPDMVRNCKTCYQAWNAAVAMLDYKYQRLPKKMSKI